MADTFFLDTSNDIAAAANYSLAAAPVDTNSVYFLRGSAFNLSVNLDQRSVADIDLALLMFGGEFSSSVGDGTSSSKYMLDDVTELRVETKGPHAQIITLDLDSCPTSIVRGTGENPKALTLIDGSYADLYISSGHITFGAGATITGNLHITQEPGKDPPVITLEAGCTVTSATIIADAGTIHSYTALDHTLMLLSGTANLKQLGTTGGANISGAVLVANRARVDIETTVASTVSNIKLVDDAVCNSHKTPHKITFGAAIVQGRSLLNIKNGVDAVTAKIAGGSLSSGGGTVFIPSGK